MKKLQNSQKRQSKKLIDSELIAEKSMSGTLAVHTDRLLFNPLTNIHGRGTKSVSNPTAQFTTLCEAPSFRELDRSYRYFQDVSSLDYEKIVPALIELMYLSGCRVSEALHIKASDILYNGQVRLSGLKGSKDRFISPSLYQYYWKIFREHHMSVPGHINRYYLDRVFKKHGLVLQDRYKRNIAVTHSFRYLFVYRMMLSGYDNSQIKDILGHLSINSTIHYVSKVKKS